MSDTNHFSPKQVKLMAKLMAVLLIWEASNEPGIYFNDIIFEVDEGNLTGAEQNEIQDELQKIAQDLLGKNIRFNTLREIINFVRKS